MAAVARCFEMPVFHCCVKLCTLSCRRLGATVVAADASSIIISTGKRNLTAAVG